VHCPDKVHFLSFARTSKGKIHPAEKFADAGMIFLKDSEFPPVFPLPTCLSVLNGSPPGVEAAAFLVLLRYGTFIGCCTERVF
jgi:hypothetical protein